MTKFENSYFLPVFTRTIGLWYSSSLQLEWFSSAVCATADKNLSPPAGEDFSYGTNSGDKNVQNCAVTERGKLS